MIVKIAREGLEDFQQSQSVLKEKQNMGGVARVIARRRKLDHRVVKVNWDAALDLETKKIGIGIIIRNSKEEIVASLWRNKKNVTNL